MKITNERKLFTIEEKNEQWILIGEVTVQENKVIALTGNVGQEASSQPAFQVSYTSQQYAVTPYNPSSQNNTVAVNMFILNVIADIEKQPFLTAN